MKIISWHVLISQVRSGCLAFAGFLRTSHLGWSTIHSIISETHSLPSASLGLGLEIFPWLRWLVGGGSGEYTHSDLDLRPTRTILARNILHSFIDSS